MITYKPYSDPALFVENALRKAVDDRKSFYKFTTSVDNLDRILKKIDVNSEDDRKRFWSLLADEIRDFKW